MLPNRFLAVVILTPAIVMADELEQANLSKLVTLLPEASIEAEIENNGHRLVLVSGRERPDEAKLLLIRDPNDKYVSADLAGYLMHWPGKYRYQDTGEVSMNVRVYWGKCFSSNPGFFWSTEGYDYHGNWNVRWEKIELTSEGFIGNKEIEENTNVNSKIMDTQTCHELKGDA